MGTGKRTVDVMNQQRSGSTHGSKASKASRGLTRGRDAVFERSFYPYTSKVVVRRLSRWYSWNALSSATLSLLFIVLASPAEAAFVHFENCMPSSIQDSHNPRILQFEPIRFSAFFDTNASTHNLEVTAYGNVTGVATNVTYPPWNDRSWFNASDILGKIVDLSPSNNKYSTLFATFNVLSYTQYDAPPTRFCNSAIGTGCPLVPAFNVSSSNITALPGFSVSHEMNSSYAFTSISTTLRVTSGDASNADLACVSATITPDLGPSLRSILTYLPLMVLILVAFATVLAAMFSPWGSLDTFHWTSNWGRDEDLLRLVTPGFGDCLQYLQFIALTGSLTLNYPGYFRPVVSSVAWSALMFNESFVTHGNGTRSLQDGVYVVNEESKYGLDHMSQLIGMTSVRDMWAGMMIWLLVIIAAVVVLIQIGFFLRWAYRQVSNVPQEDLRKKNWPFTVGNILRIVFNYFLLPTISLSMFQLVVATEGPTAGVIFSAFTLVAIIGFAGWLIYLIATVRPRSFLSDDLPTALMYGPLYNTYSDEAASFAIIQIFINLLRGIAIGAVQPSGIAQLVLLAICEIILGLTLNAIRPYPPPTSMNLYHTFLAILRAITIFLSVTFVPSLGVTEAPRGWIGYIVLLLHATGLVFGFFLNALQTIVEVAARLAGAGGHGGGATRGGLAKVFGMRQLSRRVSRRDNHSRHSMASGAAMLTPELEQKSMHMEHSRVRSMSASSAILLQRNGGSDTRSSLQDSGSAANAYHRASHSGQYTPNTPEAGSTFSKTASGHRISISPAAIVNLKQAEAADPYYRPPRQRRNTADLMSPTSRSRGSLASADMLQEVQNEPERGSEDDAGVGPSISGRVTPIQAHTVGDDYDDLTHELNRTKTDYYASREVDYYYGVRGPALSSGTRRLKTGPADPTGPVSSATGWFRNFFGGQKKEKGKGFEVVRSARAPPPGLMRGLDATAVRQEPYRDSPTDSVHPERRYTDLSTDNEPGVVEDGGYDEPYTDQDSDDERKAAHRISPIAPSLPAIDAGGDIELPSRVNSRASRGSRDLQDSSSRPPYIPRKSSKRKSSQMSGDFPTARLATVPASPPVSPRKPRTPSHKYLTSSTSGRLPFGIRNSPSKSSRYSTGAESTASTINPLGDEENVAPSYSHTRHSSSALGAHAPDIREDRPSSMGYVPQHRASDNIRKVDSGSPEFEGSSAEFVENPTQRVRPL
jgi:Transient receptor potential (TRP) ion channel/ML-like domain